MSKRQSKDAVQPGDPQPHEVDPIITHNSPSNSEDNETSGQSADLGSPSQSSVDKSMSNSWGILKWIRIMYNKILQHTTNQNPTGIESAFKKFEDAALNYVRCRLLTVALLLGLADDLTKHHRNAKAAKISGGVAGLVASGLAIGGFAASFFTFGASLVLVGVAAGLGAAGGLTAVGGIATEMISSKLTSKWAKQIIKDDDEASRKLVHAFENLNTSWQDRFEALRLTGVITVGGKVFTLVDSITDLVKVGSLTLELTEDAGTTAFKAASAFGKTAAIAGVVFSVITIPFDTYMIVSSAKYLHKKTVPQVAQCLYDIVEEMNCPSEEDMRGHIDEIRTRLGLNASRPAYRAPLP